MSRPNIEKAKSDPIYAADTIMSMYNQICDLQKENFLLKQKYWGRSTERFVAQKFDLPPDSLFNEAEIIEQKAQEKITKNQTEAPAQETTKQISQTQNDTKKDPQPKKFYAKELPVVEVIHEPDSLVCPATGEPLRKIGENIVDKIDVTPATFRITRHIYPKYVSTHSDSGVTQAKAVPSAIPGAHVEPGTIAFIAMQKYLYSMPLYRLEKVFQQCGMTVDRTAMARWMIASAKFLSPLIDLLKTHITSQKVIHADETTMQVLSGTGKKSTADTYMWLISTTQECTQPAVVFEYHPSRSSEAAAALLGSFRNGILHCDGYVSYHQVCHDRAVTRAGCWAHVRRRFKESYDVGSNQGKSLSETFLNLIKDLFMIERELQGLPPEERVLRREKQSKPIVEEIFNIHKKHSGLVLPSSKLGKALCYLYTQCETLRVFLTDGRVSLSNNHIENLVRPFAVGRKNWMFADTVAGAESSARLYSLISTAQLNELDVFSYLKDILEKIPYALAKDPKADLSPFLPWNWKKSGALKNT